MSEQKSSDRSFADKWIDKNRSLVLRQTPVWAQGVAAVVVGLSAISIVSASIFRIDEVITVPGRLIPSMGSSEIKSPVGGKIAEVMVTDGDPVKINQILAIYDTQEAKNDVKTFNSLIKIERENLLKNQNIYKNRELVYQNKLKTNQIILDSLEKLVSDGGFQRVQYLQKLDEVYELKNSLESNSLELRRIELDAEKNLNRLSNALNQSLLKIRNQTLRATVEGIVFDSIITKSTIVQQGEVLLKIVPQTGLKASINVPNKDIGFVKVGQDASIRVDAFPFSTFGELTGKVSKIGADVRLPDAVINYYSFPVVIDLQEQQLKVDDQPIRLRSGMSVQANLRLRDKPVISLLSDLLVDKTEGIKSIRQ